MSVKLEKYAASAGEMFTIPEATSANDNNVHAALSP
jgi:hypothetical protein